MSKDQSSMDRAVLREMARAAADGKTPDLQKLSRRDLESLVHEFGVYQMELETQNEQLRESENYHRQIIVSIPGMIFTNRPDGYCDFVSPQWVEYTGVAAEEQFGDGWNRLLHPEDRGRAYAAWRGAVEMRGEYNLEYRVRRRDGVYEWFKVRGSPIFDRQDRIVRWFGICMGVQELKEAEEAAQAARVAADEASRAKSEFLANMSHEIRTPMTVFMAATEQLLTLDRNPERRQLLELADRSAQRLRTLIDDILDFSRIEARKMELEQAPFDLHACAGQMVEMLGIQAREKGLRLEMNLSPAIPAKILGDAGRLEQILTNLIGNAIKFTDQGEVRVSVQVRDNRLEFAVSDTGIGIPQEKRELLFDSFTQGDSSFNRRFGGSGLGLAICKGLVELMGGTIGVKGRAGGGSEFFFDLPLTPDRRKRDREQGHAGNSGAAFADTRILLAEDEPMIREMLQMTLAQRGLRTEMAESGSEAVRKWEEGIFDLVLMDLQMPVMDGLEATRKIREKEGGSRTCIVGLTAHARREVQQECLAAGMDQVLTKPVKMTDLFEVIASCPKRTT
jgi:PAS domain S-box-containing protein